MSNYHHGNLHAAAIDEALAMLESTGPEQLTLRHLAERLGVTHRALYRHFADRDGLLSEAARRTIEELHAVVSTAADKATPQPRPRLVAILEAYVGFALARPAAYRHATHAGFAKSGAAVDLRRAARSFGAFFSATLQRDDAIAIWGMLHGLIDLYLGGSLRARTREHARQYILEVVTKHLPG